MRTEPGATHGGLGAVLVFASLGAAAFEPGTNQFCVP